MYIEIICRCTLFPPQKKDFHLYPPLKILVLTERKPLYVDGIDQFWTLQWKRIFQKKSCKILCVGTKGSPIHHRFVKYTWNIWRFLNLWEISWYSYSLMSNVMPDNIAFIKKNLNFMKVKWLNFKNFKKFTRKRICDAIYT